MMVAIYILYWGTYKSDGLNCSYWRGYPKGVWISL